MHRCPICQSPAVEKTTFFPFCSPRCRTTDLGQWIDEKYRISRPLRPATDLSLDHVEDDGAPDPPPAEDHDD